MGGPIKSARIDAMPIDLNWQSYCRISKTYVDDIDLCVVEPDPRVPLRLLLGSMEIAKMYMFEDLLAALLDAVERRLAFETFDAIFRVAIKIDLLRLRYSCLKHA